MKRFALLLVVEKGDERFEKRLNSRRERNGSCLLLRGFRPKWNEKSVEGMCNAVGDDRFLKDSERI